MSSKAKDFVKSLWEDFEFEKELENINLINAKNLDQFKEFQHSIQKLRTLSISQNPAIELIEKSVTQFRENENKVENQFNTYNQLIQREYELKTSIKELQKRRKPKLYKCQTNNKLIEKAQVLSNVYLHNTNINLTVCTLPDKSTTVVTVYLDFSKKHPIKIALDKMDRKVTNIDASSILSKSQEQVLIERFQLDMLGIIATLKFALDLERQ